MLGPLLGPPSCTQVRTYGAYIHIDIHIWVKVANLWASARPLSSRVLANRRITGRSGPIVAAPCVFAYWYSTFDRPAGTKQLSFILFCLLPSLSRHHLVAISTPLLRAVCLLLRLLRLPCLPATSSFSCRLFLASPDSPARYEVALLENSDPGTD